jgi:hypothetical protein
VQVGDLPDRGPDTDQIIELMQKLERQASRDGGMVHALMGNHEAMNIYGDLRYVHPGEYEAQRSRQARRLRDNFYRIHVQQQITDNPEFVDDDAYRELFDSQIPLGFVEHRQAWNQDGPLGSWVLEHNVLIKINRVLFLHGGLSPQMLSMSIRQINERIRTELRNGLGEEPGLLEAEVGPLWYRGLARNDELTEQAHVDALLAAYDVDHIVLGHTPGMATIVPRFGGKVLLIDTGISAYYGGHLASLLIEDGKLINVQRGQQLQIPIADEPLLPYFKAVAELEPDAQALQQLIRELEAPPATTEIQP